MGSARYPSSAWQSMRAPSLVDFEALARAAFENIAPELKALCHDLVIRVADFPTDEIIDDLDLETPFDILGLFEGPEPSDALPSGAEIEAHIFNVYRRPILDYWAGHEELLGDIVSHVMVHEIGQHFGLSDDDIEEFETRV